MADMRRPEPVPATLADVRDAAAKLCRDLGSLQVEINRFTNLLSGNSKGRGIDTARWDDSYVRQEMTATAAPRRPIIEALHEVANVDSVEGVSRLMKAMARAMDGALLDVRAARLDVKTIAEDPTVRAALVAAQRRKAPG